MTKICLIRHGETDWNAQGKIQGRTDIPLNQRGVKQAEECRDFLENSEWDVIITSPLKRARQTASIINEGLQLPLVVMDEFIERSFGDAEGMSFQERAETFPDGEYPNQEERDELIQRLTRGLQDIHDMYRGNKVLLVAHGAVINAILSTFSKGEIGSGKTRLMNACLSEIHFQDDNWMIHTFNQVAHLSDFCK